MNKSHMISHFNDPDWIINQKSGFMSDGSLARSTFFLKACVIKSEQSIRRSGGTINSGKIVAEQTLGFWTSFFDSHHYSLLSGSPLGAFSNKPSTVNRFVVANKLKNIRDFRNRIYHNEPICFRSNSIDFSMAITIMNEVYEVIEWIDPALLVYIEYFNSINKKIAMANGM